MIWYCNRLGWNCWIITWKSCFSNTNSKNLSLILYRPTGYMGEAAISNSGDWGGLWLPVFLIADWLTALPITSCGFFSGGVGDIWSSVRPGNDLCWPHVGSERHHGLVAKISKGWSCSTRHHSINIRFWGLPMSADVPVTNDQTGLLRTNGKRSPDGQLQPLFLGKYITWNATVVHTCAASNLQQTAISTGALLSTTQVFAPVAIGNLVPVNADAFSIYGIFPSVSNAKCQCIQRHYPDGCENLDKPLLLRLATLNLFLVHVGSFLPHVDKIR